MSPYDICADRLGKTKTCNHCVATIGNWKGKPSHVKENPKQISIKPIISEVSQTVKLDDKMIIEQAKVSDAEEILSLQKLAFKSEAEIYKDFNIAPLIQTLEEIKRDFGNQVFLKAVIEGKIRGFSESIC